MNWTRIGKVICEAIGFAFDDILELLEKSAVFWFVMWVVITILSAVFSLFEIIAHFDGKVMPEWMMIGPYWFLANVIAFVAWWIYYCFYRANKRLQ